MRAKRVVRPALLLCFAAGVFVVGTTTTALAQPAAQPDARAPRGPPPTKLEPPRLTSDPTPAYPRGATGAATVVLEVVVDGAGAVVEARAIEGEEPFASEAVAGARRARFEPARRDGKPVSARIRMTTTFTPPSAISPETPATETETPPQSSSPPRPPRTATPSPPVLIEEVRVTGTKGEPHTRSPTEHRMGRAETRIVPGAFGDPFRAIDILPGVVPIISGLPYFYIRGAPPSAVGYYIDEVRVPYLFHFALGPGVVQPALVEEVSLHPAAYPARYGRYAGGIVAATTRDPAKELYGEGQIRIFDAGAYVEAPFASGRASAGVGGRYSYTAGILSLFAPGTTIDYRDYNARASYAIDDRWRVSALTLGAFDYASETEQGVEQVFFASEFHRLDLRLDRRGAGGATTRIAATLGLDRTRLEGARFAQNFLTGVRARHGWPISQVVDVELGADALAESYTGDVPSPYAVSRSDYEEAQAFFAPRTDTQTGAWVSTGYRPAPGWDLVATARADVFTSDGKAAVGPSPRVSMRLPLVGKTSFLAAVGIAPQPPAFAIPVPAVGYRGLPGGLAFAYQKSAGVEVLLPWKFTFKGVGFHHSYFSLRDFGQGSDVDIERPQFGNISPTQAYGAELSLMRKLSERFSAFASGTLSRAQLGSTSNTAPRVSPFDRTWVAQIGGVVDLGRHWRTSSRVLGYRGWPGTAEEGGRLPPFFRIDLRIEKRWLWNDRRYLAFVMEGLNVTGSTEVVSRSCNIDGVCKEDRLPPIIIPSFGLEGAL